MKKSLKMVASVIGATLVLALSPAGVANAASPTPLPAPEVLGSGAVMANSSGASVASSSVQTSNTPTTGAVSVQYLPIQTPGTIKSAVIASPCTLAIQNVYPRKSGNYGTVGTKATTTCSVTVTSIHQSIDIEKLGTLGNWETQGIFYDWNFVASTLPQTNAAVVCTNKISTTWSGYASGEVVYAGTTYYASVNANVAPGLACGT